MRILFITSSYPEHESDPHGIFVHRLARALQQQGAMVTVVAPATPSAPTNESLQGVKVQRARYWPTRWETLATDFAGIVPSLRKRPWRVLQVPPLVAALSFHTERLARTADVVHAHWIYPAGICGWFGARRHSKPWIVTSHGSDLALARRQRVMGRLSRAVCTAADMCIGVSEALCQDLKRLGVPETQVRFVPLGVDLPTGPPEGGQPESDEYNRFRDQPGFHVVYVGRLIPLKSVETLLVAHKVLKERGYRVACALVGAGPSEPALRRLVQRENLDNVIFAGAQSPDRTKQWLAAADVLVLPSVSEGRGIVLAEAMAHRLPVVASDIPGPSELVRNGETGLLFTPRDAEGLANCLERLLRDRGLARRLGERGRQFLVQQGLTTEESARRHMSVYREVVESRL